MLRVIGAGYPRTGTSSLQTALERSGFGPCYHMRSVINDESVIPNWVRAWNGEVTDWEEILGGYRATVDMPGCFYYKQLADFYPDAKVILTERPSDEWFRSCIATIFNRDRPGGSIAERRAHPIGRFADDATPFNQDLTHDRDYMIGLFERHNEEVRRAIPAERLLIYDVRQGWEPLCAFLGIAVPEIPFPHDNSTPAYKDRFGLGEGQTPAAFGVYQPASAAG